MNIYAQIAEKIIEEQENIIGPVALEQARKVQGLKVDWQKHEIELSGNETDILEKLVEQYKGLFGQASVEACKEAAGSLLTQIPQNKIPSLLQ